MGLGRTRVSVSAADTTRSSPYSTGDLRWWDYCVQGEPEGRAEPPELVEGVSRAVL